MKKTKTRQLVSDILISSNSPLSAYDIFEQLKGENITLSSIYRTLDTFCKEGIILKDTDSNGISVYTTSENHQHYLEFKTCHQKISITDCPYHKINKQIKKQLGYLVDEHDVILYGTCKNCQSKK